VIAAGQLSANVTITPVADGLDELDDTVVLTLGAPTNATLGGTTVHTATIQDDDATPTVAFAAASQDVVENAGAVTVSVELSALSGLEVSVPFSVGGTASDPDDYGLSASPVVIPAGQLSADITLTPVDDVDGEADETVELTLDTPTGATLGATTVHTATIQDDDGGPALAVLDGGGVSSQGYLGVAAAMAVPFDVFDDDSRPVRALVQWKRAGEAFPPLPTTSQALLELLGDPGRASERAALQIATELPPEYAGEASALGLAADEVRLPELSGSARDLLQRGVAGRPVELLRSGRAPAALNWIANRLAGPRGAVVAASGLTALVLDEDPGGWRLRELEIATGTVLRLVAAGDGAPRALTAAPGGAVVFVGSSTRVFRLDLAAADVTSVPHGFTDGPRGLAAADADVVHATGDSALVRFDLTLGDVSPTSLGLATPWGVAFDPADDGRLYVAETSAHRIVVVDTHTGARSLFAGGAASALASPRALVVDRTAGRLLVVAEDDDGAGAIRALELGFEDRVALEPTPVVALGDVGDPSATLAVGADELVLAVVPGSGALLVSGGVEQRRIVLAHDPDTDVVRVDAPFDPFPGEDARWRMQDELGLVDTDPSGRRHVFVWDTRDVVGGGRVELRVIPVVIDGEIGDWIAEMPPRRVEPPASAASTVR
jgi:hypothetical protein